MAMSENTGLFYELTDETIEVRGHTLHRIRALKDINKVVHTGDLGGFVESTANLDASCGAWVYDSARVYGNARIHGDVEVCEGES